MDWRDRKYYAVSFGPLYNKYVSAFAQDKNLKLHPAKWPHVYKKPFPDEKVSRGYYQILISCKEEYEDVLLFKLYAIRNEPFNHYFIWYKEILSK